MKLGYSPSRYMRDEQGNGTMFTTLRMDDPNVDALFGAESPVMLLGISEMMGLFFEFDLARRRVGIAKY